MVNLEVWALFFFGIIATSLLIDKCAESKTDGSISFGRAVIILSIWISLALLFDLGIYHYMGSKKSLKFLIGYFMELLLSVDNVLLFIAIFRQLAIPNKQQYSMLFIGIMAAIIMRLGFILMLTNAMKNFHWVSYLLTALLIFTGVKMWPNSSKEGEKVDVKESGIIKAISRFIPISNKIDGNKLIIIVNGKVYFTRVMIALVLIIQTDLLFAMDSIPAIIAITRDNFIIFSSNLFALLGLRSLFFIVHHITSRIAFINYALSMMLVFMGVKMGMKTAGISIPIAVTVSMVLVIILFCYMVWGRREKG